MGSGAGSRCGAPAAPDETVILLHPPLPLVGLSIAMERERQQNDSLANGNANPEPTEDPGYDQSEPDT